MSPSASESGGVPGDAVGITKGFGALLRARRTAAGFTQLELAERAGIGVRTVRDLETGRSSRPHRTTVELLARALNLAGADLASFLDTARGRLAPPAAAGPRNRVRLPPPDPLIGRDCEIAEITARLVQQQPLITLVGLAGVGKSSLSLAAAAQAAEAFPGGVSGVRVGPSDSSEEIIRVIRHVIGGGTVPILPVSGSPPPDSAVRSPLDGPALIVVDGVDDAAEAVTAAVTELLDTTPKLQFLTSARVPLGLLAEQVWPVRPLPVPPAEVATVAAARQHPASALFLSRLDHVRGRPAVDAEIPAAVALVRWLGGLPLAIELAAARGRVFNPPELLSRYAGRLLELRGETPGTPGTNDQMRTLRDVVAASYRLLAPAQQAAVRQLACFCYRWSIELAEDALDEVSAVFQAEPVLMLERLVELGLVQVRGTGAVRFLLLEPIQAYALEQARKAGELIAIRSRHAQVLARFAARVAPELAGATLTRAVARLDDVANDLVAALEHAADHDPHTALCLASKLPRWWRFRGRDQQGREWLLKLLADPRTAGTDPLVRTWAQLGVVQLAAEHGEGMAEVPRAEAALADFVRTGDTTGELAARAVLLAVYQVAGQHVQARQQALAALATAGRLGRARDMAIAHHNLIWHDLRDANLLVAQQRLAAVDRLSARCGEHQLRALARANLAEVLRLDGRFDESVRVGQQAAELLAEVGHPTQRRRMLGTIGLAYAMGGRLREAENVLAELRGRPGGEGPSGSDAMDAAGAEDWDSAMIEASLAQQRGQRLLAASWYAAAVLAADRTDVRDRAEALVGLVVTCEEPQTVREQLQNVCREAGITLTRSEQQQLSTVQ